MKDWSVYILRCRDGTLYTGVTVNLEARLEAHQRGTAAKYTRSRRPVAVASEERQPDRSSAQKREAALRRLGRTGKLALIATVASPALKASVLVNRSPREYNSMRPRRRA